jgi:hypothetical protein
MKALHLVSILGVLVLMVFSGMGCSGSPTSVSSFNLTGTVTYQGGGSGKVYVFLQNQTTNGPVSMSAALNSGSTYSFLGINVFSELFAAYDNTGNGFKIVSNGPTSTTLVQGNGASLAGSGDVVCLVGYIGGCPNANTQAAQGTYFSTTTGLNIVFGGALNQSGTSCGY